MHIKWLGFQILTKFRWSYKKIDTIWWSTRKVCHRRTRKGGGHAGREGNWWHERHGWFSDSEWNPQHENLTALWTYKSLQVSVGFLVLDIIIYWSIFPGQSTCSRFNTYPSMRLYDLKHPMKIKATHQTLDKRQKFMATLVCNVMSVWLQQDVSWTIHCSCFFLPLWSRCRSFGLKSLTLPCRRFWRKQSSSRW